MSSLGLALQLSLRESHAPNTTTTATAAPCKGKKAAVRIITPEQEHVPPPAAAPPSTEMIGLSQQDKPRPPASAIFSNVTNLAEIATKLQVPEKSSHCVELFKDGSVCGVDGCHCPPAAGMEHCMQMEFDAWCTTGIDVQSQTKSMTGAIVSLVLNTFALLIVNVPLVPVMMPSAKELDAQVSWPNFRNSRPLMSSLQQVPKIMQKQKQRPAMELVKLPLHTLIPSILVMMAAKEPGSWNNIVMQKKTFRDSDGKCWCSNPPPNWLHPKKFKDEELNGGRMLPRERWWQQKPLPPWVAVLSRSEWKGGTKSSINKGPITSVAPPAVALAPDRKKSHSELEGNAKEALKRAPCWEKLANKTKGDKATLEKRALQNVAEKDKEMVEQTKAI
jgi:hypothetical protein